MKGILVKLRKFFVAAILASGTSLASSAHAADCPVDVEDPWDLEAAGVTELYNCLKDQIAEGYAKEGDEIAAAIISCLHRVTASGLKKHCLMPCISLIPFRGMFK